MIPEKLRTYDFRDYCRYTGPFGQSWRENIEKYQIEPQATPQATAYANLARVVELANNWRKHERNTPVGLTLYPCYSKGSLFVRLLITSDDAFILVNEAAQQCALNSKGEQVGVFDKPKNMSIDEFFLSACYAARSVGNQLLGFYQEGEDAQILTSTYDASFNTAFYRSLKIILTDSVSHPELLEKAVKVAARANNRALFELVGARALEKASETGDLTTLCNLIMMGVPPSSDAKALAIAKANDHQKIVNFFDTLSRMSGSSL